MLQQRDNQKQGNAESAEKTNNLAPSISLPKGGGAIRGIDEKFSVNPVTGTGSLSVPIFTSPGRSDFSPDLSLDYDSGAGNGPFGLGWNLSIPSITRKTDKGVPKYQDAEESDTFILSGAEDLVPLLEDVNPDGPSEYDITRYRPRIEGLFARIEKWENKTTGEVFWKSISKDNITSIYGKSASSRIADPDDETRVFKWLLEESYDDKGNVILYEYKPENENNIDPSLPQEKNRIGKDYANRYLKRVKYGNTKPRSENPDPDSDYLFEVVFDYGDHNKENPTPDDDKTQTWKPRQDAFSSFRAGFEIRTQRLCQRVLMFHHFKELGATPCLVRSTDFSYQESPIISYLETVTQTGYVKKENAPGYDSKSLPPLEFSYTEAKVDETIRCIDAESLENLPIGLDGAQYQWVDLDGEGISGILTEQANAWFYKRNLGNTRLAPTQLVATKPSPGSLQNAQIMDLAGDGQKDLVLLDEPLSGFYERTEDGCWNSFVPFTSFPNVRWNDPNLRFVDLNGDGHADVLVTEDEVFTWYPSEAEDGFGPSERVPKAYDEEKGPTLVFADATQSVYLADMSGDGLSDIVRIRNGDVCYWPNLGYGRFGAKVTMDTPPYFDVPDLFDQKRIRLADIDGSGTTDIIYLGSNIVSFWYNQSGNSWSPPYHLTNFPKTDNLSSVTVVDLLGKGTACIVWSSPLPGEALQPMRYIDLMSQGKPHLLESTKNNLGTETKVKYASSTKFYLQDLEAGRPWSTKLPFPVHVLERVETYDRISRNRFVSRYAFHHGYFDGIEREFRGFGLVEQRDTEEFAALSASDTFPIGDNIDQASYMPPVLTKTWFHTGAYRRGQKISKQFEDEYYRESDQSEGIEGLTDEQFQAMLLDDTVLPDGLTTEETREACRALKGSILRQEVYALDRTNEEDRPYSVSESNYTIKRLQPQQSNKHAVFFVHSREAINFHYERKLYDIGGQKLADPRVSHSMTLKVDDYGNVERAVAISYPRRNVPDLKESEQQETHIVLTVNRVANYASQADWYRIGLPIEARSYEIVKPPEPERVGYCVKPFDFGDIDTLITNLFPLNQQEPEEAMLWPYELWNWRHDPTNAPAETRLRLIEYGRTLYRRNNLSGPRPLGEVESLALPFESYTLAFTPGLLDVYKSKITPGDLQGVLRNDGKYVDLDGDGHWWIPSGKVFYSPDENDTPTQELAEAQAHFFLPRRFQDPFGQTATVNYDANDLLMVGTRDALGNEVSAENDYRVLQPWHVTDPNLNRTEAAFDALGMVIATAVMGKENETDPDKMGDTLNDPTTRLEYDLFNWVNNGQPNYVRTCVREKHRDPSTRWQESYSYSDGFGREIQKKIQAEPGEVEVEDAAGNLTVVDTTPELRWVGSGWTIFNNKGKPVRQYEPFFSTTHAFEFAKIVGVSPILFYDPVGRVIATLHPNHTYEKVLFDPWLQKTYDVNDTAAFDPRTDADIKGYVKQYFESQAPDWKTWLQERIDPQNPPQDVPGLPPEQAAAVRTLKHADTPAIAHFDVLGRPFLSIADNGVDENSRAQLYETRVHLDIEGNQREVIDAKGRVVMRYDYYMAGPDENEEGAGNLIHQASMEAGERWMLNDVAGKPIRAWDSRKFMRRMTYDELRRPIGLFVTENGVERLAERTVYGENQGDANNHKTRVYQVFDGAGVVTNEIYDFKGNLRQNKRELLPDYQHAVDWLQNPIADDGTFTTSTEYDALNRPTAVTTPDNSVYHPTFNEANLLNAVDVNLRGEQEGDQPKWTSFVTNIDYDAKGQRTLIEYGNGVKTEYEYDPETFRLRHLNTTRPSGLNGLAFQLFADPTTVQDLYYTYDPVGNITNITDEAIPTIQYNNKDVEPDADYSYDAIYRLISAHGREHIGQTAFNFNPAEGKYQDYPFVGRHASPNDPRAVRNYTETYDYDEVGNIKNVRHAATNGGWTRVYAYNEPSLLGTGKQNNRLTSTQVGNGLNSTESYEYTDAQGNDVHGCMTAINSMKMEWDFQDQLHAVQRQVVNDEGEGEKAYYVYDAVGQRVRKVIVGQNGFIKKERIYLGGFEIYREYNPSTSSGQAVKLERETLHIMDDQQRIALVETKTDGSTSVIRYQFGNHLGSASLELDAAGAVISYEEYYPYGSTSYQAGRSIAEAGLKRYRYTGKERDEESGLYYYGARYFAPWLARWISCDPVGIEGGINLYLFGDGSPTIYTDPSGLAPKKYEEQRGKDTSAKRKEMVKNISEAKKKKYKIDPMQMRAEEYTKKKGRTPIQQHHHRGVKQAAEVKLDPKKMGDPMSSVWSTKRDPSVKAGIGDKPVWDPDLPKKGKRTPHNIAKHLDFDEQAKGPKTAKDLEAASEASKQRLPATADMTERAKYDWTRIEPKGPPVDPKTGKVISKEAKLAKVNMIGSEITEKTIKKLGKKALKVVPLLGIGVGLTSAKAEAAQGNYGTAALDIIGLVPVVGDVVDAARLGIAIGEASNEILGIDDVATECGERFEKAARYLGLGKDVSSIIGATGAAISSITIAPSIALNRKAMGWFR